MVSGSGQTSQEDVTDLESGFLRQRRNLLTLSIGLIVYCVSGGQIEKVNLLFGMISIKNHQIIEYFIWMLQFYFLWRYWLYREPVQSAFKLALINQVSNGTWYHNLVTSVSKEYEGLGNK